jgi:hypothetical protein
MAINKSYQDESQDSVPVENAAEHYRKTLQQLSNKRRVPDRLAKIATVIAQLNETIDNHLTKLKKKAESSGEDSKYADKIKVLDAAKEYLKGFTKKGATNDYLMISGMNQLLRSMQDNKQYRQSFLPSETRKLVADVMALHTISKTQQTKGRNGDHSEKTQRSNQLEERILKQLVHVSGKSGKHEDKFNVLQSALAVARDPSDTNKLLLEQAMAENEQYAQSSFGKSTTLKIVESVLDFAEKNAVDEPEEVERSRTRLGS